MNPNLMLLWLDGWNCRTGGGCCYCCYKDSSLSAFFISYTISSWMVLSDLRTEHNGRRIRITWEGDVETGAFWAEGEGLLFLFLCFLCLFFICRCYFSCCFSFSSYSSATFVAALSLQMHLKWELPRLKFEIFQWQDLMIVVNPLVRSSYPLMCFPRGWFHVYPLFFYGLL